MCYPSVTSNRQTIRVVENDLESFGSSDCRQLMNPVRIKLSSLLIVIMHIYLMERSIQTCLADTHLREEGPRHSRTPEASLTFFSMTLSSLRTSINLLDCTANCFNNSSFICFWTAGHPTSFMLIIFFVNLTECIGHLPHSSQW